MLALPNDDPRKTLFIALLLCLVCAVLVSSAATILKDKQRANKAADIKANILAVTGLLPEKATASQIETLFKQFEIKAVDLNSGEYVDIDVSNYDQREAAKDPDRSIKLAPNEDIAKIGRRANIALVYLLKERGKIKQVVLPVHGYGLWSTLYGFIALESDLNTIKGLRFYEQGETPGLGGEVDNPKWRQQWEGKKVFDDNGQLKIKVIHGHVSPSDPDAAYKVDGISGATLTSRGVSNLLNFWLGDRGFGPYLKKLRSKQ